MARRGSARDSGARCCRHRPAAPAQPQQSSDQQPGDQCRAEQREGPQIGAIARLGSGEWAYVVTPVGFYVGCLTVGTIFSPPPPSKLSGSSPLFDAAMWLAVLFAGFMLFRVVSPLLSAASDGASQTFTERLRTTLATRIWSPHAATAVIGITFVVILLLIGGTWAYTDALAELARGMAEIGRAHV